MLPALRWFEVGVYLDAGGDRGFGRWLAGGGNKFQALVIVPVDPFVGLGVVGRVQGA